MPSQNGTKTIQLIRYSNKIQKITKQNEKERKKERKHQSEQAPTIFCLFCYYSPCISVSSVKPTQTHAPTGALFFRQEQGDRALWTFWDTGN